MEECEKEDPKTPWEQQEKGKVFFKWFEEYRGSVTKLKPVAPPLSVGNQVVSYIPVVNRTMKTS